jgi:hypothetical protein
MGLYARRQPFLSGSDFASVWIDIVAFGSVCVHGSRSSAALAFRLLEPIAVAIHLKNVDVVGEPVEQRAREAV